MVTAIIAVLTIGLIEILQFWAPGRHARLEDFVVDATAACAGIAMAAALGWLTRQARPSPT
jgi:VanZ family protein